MHGLFVTIDGVDGVGKSTLIVDVAERLARENVPVRAIRLPGATALGEALREVFLSDGFDALPFSEALLLYASFYEAYARLAAPLRAQGYVVLADRFCDSCYVYQGAPGQEVAAKIGALNDLVFPGELADLRFILDAPTSVCAERLARKDVFDRFDRSDFSTLEGRRRAYLARAQRGSPQAIVVDNSGALGTAVERVAESILFKRASLNPGGA